MLLGAVSPGLPHHGSEVRAPVTAMLLTCARTPNASTEVQATVLTNKAVVREVCTSQCVWPAAINGLHKTWLSEGCQMTFNIPDGCQQRGPHAEDHSSV